MNGNTLVKLLMSSDIDGTIIRIITGKILVGISIGKLNFLIISKV